MRFTLRLASILAAAVAVLALGAAAASATQSHHHRQDGRSHHPSHHHHHPLPPAKPPHHGPGGHHGKSALFAQTDNPAGNEVVAYKRFPDGHLVQAGTYATGGLGGVLDGAVVDFLASQDSLSYDPGSRLLYAVNAGSDTVTVFAVSGDRLTRIQVVGSGGDFPVSIAVHGHLVYVLNAREGGAIQGYVQVAGHLLPVPSWNRKLGLDPNATPEFTSTPGQVAFTPDGSQLLVTTKGSGNSVDVFGIGPFGAPSAKPTVNEMPGTAPFALAFDQQGRPVVTQSATNAVASFNLDAGGTLHPIATAATGQEATCWIARAGTRFYASNAGSASVSGFAVDAAGGLTPLGNTATHGGTVDAVSVEDRFLYVQTGAEGIIDEFKVEADGSLTPLGSVTVPNAVGGEGIAAS